MNDDSKLAHVEPADLATAGDGVNLLDEAQRGLRESTKKAYAGDWRRFGAWWEGRSASQAVHDLFFTCSVYEARRIVESYCQSMRDRGLQNATIARARSTFNKTSRSLSYAGRTTWTLDLPDNYKRQHYRDTRGPGVDDWKILVRALQLALEEAEDGGDGDPRLCRDIAILFLLRDSGLRRAEVCSLDLEHVHFAQSEVSVLGKGRDARYGQTMNNSTRRAVEAWIRVRGTAPGPLFCRTTRRGELLRGERLNGDAVFYIVGKRGAEVGIDGLTPHKLRHAGITAAAQIWDKGLPALVRFARHENPSTTMIYVDSVGDQPRQIADLLELQDDDNDDEQDA